MALTKSERIEVGKKIHEGEMSGVQAALQYGELIRELMKKDWKDYRGPYYWLDHREEEEQSS